MPGSTIHIMFAHLLNPNASTEFYAGSIAIDAVDDYHEKDKTHFRKIPNRAQKLYEYAKSLPKNDFNEGMISHLYLDWRWDACELNRFIDEHGEGWFKPYRTDLSKISHHFSNTLPYVKEIWKRIYELPIEKFGDVPSATPQMVRNFVDFGYESSKETRDEPIVFHADEVLHFLEMTALEYKRFFERMENDVHSKL